MNVIISGLPEGEMMFPNDDDGDEGNVKLSKDKEKIYWLIRFVGSNHFTEDQIINFLITRICKERDEFNRIVNITLESIEDRD